MKMSKEIDDYLLRKLNKEEKGKFEQELNENEELARLVDIHKEVNESITDEEIHQLRQKIQSVLNQRRGRKTIQLRYILAAASILVLGFTLMTILKQPDYSKTYTTFYQPYETDLTLRSSETKAEGLDFAILLYEKREYETSFSILENYTKTTFNNHTALFYLGLSALELEKFEVAEKSLNEVINTEDPALKLHAKWYLSMLYLKTNQLEQARFFLNDLNKTENYYSRRVKKVLKKVG